jgi:hypothetical protein
LEVIYFPQGKGDPRWQQKSDRLFLGIDHTAIAVSSTENSLRYYRDLLGMRLAGESMNYGTEQSISTISPVLRLRISGLARKQRSPESSFSSIFHLEMAGLRRRTRAPMISGIGRRCSGTGDRRKDIQKIQSR